MKRSVDATDITSPWRSWSTGPRVASTARAGTAPSARARAAPPLAPPAARAQTPACCLGLNLWVWVVPHRKRAVTRCAWTRAWLLAGVSAHICCKQRAAHGWPAASASFACLYVCEWAVRAVLWWYGRSVIEFTRRAHVWPCGAADVEKELRRSVSWYTQHHVGLMRYWWCSRR